MLWNSKVSLIPGEVRDLARWTEIAVANPWLGCLDERPATLILATDASEWGWGALYLDTEVGTVLTHSQPWTEQEREAMQLQHSVYAEPEAVFRALCRFVRPDEHRAVVAVLTDSTTARFALSRGYSPSFLVNAIAHRCQNAFKNVRLDFYHVPGTLNAVDPFSRGMSPPLRTATPWLHYGG